MNYMIDTCIFNYLCDGFYSLEDLPSGNYYITHIQRDELKATPDNVRREILEEQLHVVKTNKVLTTITVSGTSRSGESSCGAGNTYNIVLSKLDNRKKNKNNFKDAIIGETAMQNNFYLITSDFDFSEVMKEVWSKKNVIYWSKKANILPNSTP